MKKILLGLVAAACLTSFALPVFAEGEAPAGEKTEKKAKKSKKSKKAKEGAGEAGEKKAE